MVLADVGLIDFIFLTAGKNPEKNVRRTSVWFSKQGNWKEGGPERGQTQPASMCQGDTGHTKEQVDLEK